MSGSSSNQTGNFPSSRITLPSDGPVVSEGDSYAFCLLDHSAIFLQGMTHLFQSLDRKIAIKTFPDRHASVPKSRPTGRNRFSCICSSACKSWCTCHYMPAWWFAFLILQIEMFVYWLAEYCTSRCMCNNFGSYHINSCTTSSPSHCRFEKVFESLFYLAYRWPLARFWLRLCLVAQLQFFYVCAQPLSEP